MDLPIQMLHPAATMPSRAHHGDAGLDLTSVEAVTLKPGARASVGTGIAIALPEGMCALVVPRSGLATRHGIGAVNAPGLIDAGYRGEIRCLLINHDLEEPFEIAVGDRIAQLVVMEIPQVAPVAVAELPESARGAAGFGSSGR